MTSAALDAHAARFSATLRSVLASTHFGETVTVDAKTPSFKTSRLVHRSIPRVSFLRRNHILCNGLMQDKFAAARRISHDETESICR
jgi:hypothetical protein